MLPFSSLQYYKCITGSSEVDEPGLRGDGAEVNVDGLAPAPVEESNGECLVGLGDAQGSVVRGDVLREPVGGAFERFQVIHAIVGLLFTLV